MNALFELFFSYPLDWFQRGQLALGVTPVVAGIALAVVAILVIVSYLRVPAASRRLRATLIGLRWLAFTVLLFCIAQPALLLSTPVASRDFIAVLIDDSASMSIADEGGRSRREAVVAALDPVSGELYADLAARFDVRMFGFGHETLAVSSLSELTFSAGQTELAQALDDVRERFAGRSLAGVVVVTDGGDNSQVSTAQALLRLRSAGVPLYSVGVGNPTASSDIEVLPPRAPARLLMGSSAFAEVGIRNQGYAGRTVTLIVEHESRILAQQELVLDPSGNNLIRLPLRFDVAGVQELLFRVQPEAGERITENNRRHLLLDVYNDRERILYVEGEPRFEFKFLRRAIAKDPNIDVVGLLRTAENKFYRVGISSAEELASGFPTTREDLFRYRGLIIGNVEVAFFTDEQQQLIQDFVAERGGGVLFLGGKRAFAEGGYGDSLLADVMPVTLGDRAASDFFLDVVLHPTATAIDHPLVQLDLTGDEPIRPWTQLPAITIVNPLVAAKPGARTLLSATMGNDQFPVLVAQRYGRGQAVAFAVQNSWVWQMHPDISIQDQTHEILWRRLLRWLVTGGGERLSVEVTEDVVSPGETVRFGVEIRDQGFVGVANAPLQAMLISPSGRERAIELVADPRHKGRYQAQFLADESGLFELKVVAESELEQGSAPGVDESAETLVATAFVRVDALAREFFDPQRNDALLQRLAADGGGQFRPLADASAFARQLLPATGGATVTARHPLWQMPVLLLLMIFAVCGEWWLRRNGGLR